MRECSVPTTCHKSGAMCHMSDTQAKCCNFDGIFFLGGRGVGVEAWGGGEGEGILDPKIPASCMSDCQVSCVMLQVSHVRCQVSHIFFALMCGILNPISRCYNNLAEKVYFPDQNLG